MIEKRYDIVNETCNRLIQILCLVGVKLEYFKYFIKDTKENKYLTISDTIDLLNEQQTIIDKQELRLQHLEEIVELSENLNKRYREKLIDMNLKMVMIDD